MPLISTLPVQLRFLLDSGGVSVAAGDEVVVVTSKLSPIGGRASVELLVVQNAEDAINVVFVVDVLDVSVEELARPLAGLPGGPSGVAIADLRASRGIDQTIEDGGSEVVTSSFNGGGAKVLAVGVGGGSDNAILNVAVGAGYEANEGIFGRARVDGVLLSYWTTPPDTLDVCRGSGVLAAGTGRNGRDALDQNVEALAIEFVVALGGASGDVVALQ